eukprot:8857877-Ditylum_brightwellii.AAC.1
MIRDAMETQNKIGWDNFIKCQMCIKWKFAQYMFKKAMPTFGGHGKEAWSSKVITALWNVFCLIWNARNAHLHTKNGNEEFFHDRPIGSQGFLTPALHVHFQLIAIPHAAT